MLWKHQYQHCPINMLSENAFTSSNRRRPRRTKLQHTDTVAAVVAAASKQKTHRVNRCARCHKTTQMAAVKSLHPRVTATINGRGTISGVRFQRRLPETVNAGRQSRPHHDALRTVLF